MRTRDFLQRFGISQNIYNTFLKMMSDRIYQYVVDEGGHLYPGEGMGILYAVNAYNRCNKLYNCIVREYPTKGLVKNAIIDVYGGYYNNYSGNREHKKKKTKLRQFLSRNCIPLPFKRDDGDYRKLTDRKYLKMDRWFKDTIKECCSECKIKYEKGLKVHSILSRVVRRCFLNNTEESRELRSWKLPKIKYYCFVFNDARWFKKRKCFGINHKKRYYEHKTEVPLPFKPNFVPLVRH